MKKIFITTLILFSVSTVYGALRHAVNSGYWEEESTWYLNNEPGCGDTIIIPAGLTITITSNLDYTPCLSAMKLSVLGELVFQTGKKLRLPCGSAVYVFDGGSIDPGVGGGNSNLIDICGITVWNAAMGPLTGPDCLPSSPGCNNMVLPIDLLSFSVEAGELTNVISWITASEKENDYFNVEKSIDGKNFHSIAQINGAGSSAISISYEFEDYDIFNGKSYYRLRQTDYNGTFSFSKTIAVESEKFEMFFYPNPATDKLYITQRHAKAGISILDSRGEEVMAAVISGNAVIDISELRSGLYFIKSEKADGKAYKLAIE